ncbi:hypothetical protein PHJA_000339000 [Phtheirospermum japonicum]|uniref:Uncharacterized protein n=1 Tax=Phtheirospermum japonicum TaxID=374723 RepID=A0A830B4D1_9LAMI|nr:hypothetical protein PHJA_000339000 [Phtheirospermum japonicum]
MAHGGTERFKIIESWMANMVGSAQRKSFGEIWRRVSVMWKPPWRRRAREALRAIPWVEGSWVLVLAWFAIVNAMYPSVMAMAM